MNAFVENDRVVVILPENMEREKGKEFEDLFSQCAEKGNFRFVVDAKRLSYIGSFGLSMLLRKTRDLDAVGGEVKIRNLGGQPLKIVVETGMANILHLENAEGAASPEQTKSTRAQFESAIRNHVAVLRIEGSLYFPQGTTRLAEEIKKAAATAPNILLDFGKLGYLDSQTVNELLSLNQLIRSREGKMVIVGVSGIVKETLEMLNIEYVIPILETEETGLREIGPAQ